eukprot:4684170-Pyramimonas_sp.AAC.1
MAAAPAAVLLAPPTMAASSPAQSTYSPGTVKIQSRYSHVHKISVAAPSPLWSRPPLHSRRTVPVRSRYRDRA